MFRDLLIPATLSAAEPEFGGITEVKICQFGMLCCWICIIE